MMFNATKARKLSGRVKERKIKEKWNWKDTLELKKVEILIKRSCQEGGRELLLYSYPGSRVIEKLKINGYNVSKGDIGLEIKW